MNQNVNAAKLIKTKINLLYTNVVFIQSFFFREGKIHELISHVSNKAVEVHIEFV